MKKRIFLVIVCLLTLAVSLCLFTGCLDNDTDTGDTSGDGSTENGGSEGGAEGGSGTQQPIKHTVTFKADGVTVGTVEFTEGDTTVTAPSVPSKQCRSGAWESYTLGTENITVNAVYTVLHSALTHNESVEAKCNAEGNIEYWSCSGCNKYYSDANGNTEISDKAGVILPKVDCSYVSDVCKWCQTKRVSLGLVYELSADETYYTVTSVGTCSDDHIIVPSEYNGKPVKAIGRVAFYGSPLTAVTIPGSIEILGDRAFGECESLKDVIFEENSRLKRVEDGAFSGCESIISLALPEGVEYIGYNAFYNTSMRTFTIPSSVKTLDNYVFSGCFKLVEVINKTDIYVREETHGLHAMTVHNGESKIVNKDGYLFITSDGVNYLIGYVGEDIYLTLPHGYNGEEYKIYSYAFSKNNNIKTVVIPDKVTAIGSGAFSNCESLLLVDVSNSVETVGGFAFYYCTSLSVVGFNRNTKITVIDEYTFRGCGSLEVIGLLENLVSIGEEAFCYCTSLESINLPKSLESIGKKAFYSCTALETISYLGTEGRWNAVSKAEGWDTLAADYKVYYFGVIGECDYLIHHERTEAKCNATGNVEYWACGDCDKIYSDANAENEITDRESVILPKVDCSYDFCMCIWCSGEKHTLVYTAATPSTCTENGQYENWHCTECSRTFEDSEAKTEMFNRYIPIVDCSYTENGCKWCGVGEGSEGLEYRLGPYNIYYVVFGIGTCTDTEIVIPTTYNGKPVCEIAYGTFRNQKHVVSVVIGNNVQKIGDYAFEYCRGLVSVTLGTDVTTIGTDAFNHCNKLVETINKSSLELTAGSNSNGRVAQFALAVHDGKSKIVNKNDFLFYEHEDSVNYLVGYVGADRDIVFPNSYNGEGYVIYRYTFAERSDISKITLTTGVTGIQYRAFWRCSQLSIIEFVGQESQWEAIEKEDNWAQESGNYVLTFKKQNQNLGGNQGEDGSLELPVIPG